LIATVASMGGFGAALVILAGVVGVALIVAVGTWSSRRPPTVGPASNGPLAAVSARISRARDTLAHRTHPVVAALLTLIVGIAVATIVTYAFGRLVKLGVIVHLDRPVDHFVDVHRISLVSRLMLTGTLLGSYTVVYTIAVTGGLLLLVLARRLLPLVVLVLATPLEIELQKHMDTLIHGTKPAQSVAIGPPGAFFSGGSARTLIVCGLLAYVVASLGLERRQRALLWTLVALATFAEGYSRLYLGRHYAVDIVGGWLIGSLVVVSIVFAADALRPSVAEAAVHEPASEPATFSGGPSRHWSWRPTRMLICSSALLMVLAILAGVLVATQTNGRTLTVAQRNLLVPTEGALFGAWVQPVRGSGVSGEESAVTSLESQLGRKLAIDQLYVQWGAPMPLVVARWDLEQRIIPMISWAGAPTDLIADGRYDTQIRSRALQLRNLNGPVLLRWFAEMDGSQNRANAVSPSSFIAAWRHIHDIFASVGATNVVWVWCPNADGFATGAAQKFYPGSAYVDWIGADGYNWAPAIPSAAWTSFGDIFSAFYRWGSSKGKPLLVGEYGVLEGAPGEKAAWFTQADSVLRTQFHSIRAVVYFDSDDNGEFNWRVTTSPSAFAAFREFATDPYFSAEPPSSTSSPASA
jgi:membrane-associated phospholipid phosphatase